MILTSSYFSSVSLKKLFHHHFWLILILGIAAFLRLYRLEELMRFIWDEGRDMQAISEIVKGDFTLFGPFNEIDGKKDFFGVFHYYLMAPALWAAHFDPVGPALMTALLGVIAVGLCYVWARPWLGEKAALVVTAFMAVSPLVVQYVRWPWNPNTTGFFGILFLLSIQAWQKKPRWWLSLLSGLLLGLLFQLHYFTIPLGLVALVVFGWQPGITLKQKLISLVLVGVGFVTPNLSFVIFDVTHAGFYRTIILESFFSTSPGNYLVFQPLHLVTTPVQYLWQVTSHFLGSKWLGLGAALIFGFWVIRVIKTTIHERTATESLQLVVVWLGFVFMISFFPALKDEYHSAALWLALPVAFVSVLQPWWKKISPHLQTGLIALLLIWLIAQNNLGRAPRWDENLPLVRAASLAVAQDAQDAEMVNIASFVDSDTRATRFRYFVTQNNVSLQGIDQYPNSQVLYIITPHSWSETRQNPAWELASFRDSSAHQVWEANGWKVIKLQKNL